MNENVAALEMGVKGGGEGKGQEGEGGGRRSEHLRRWLHWNLSQGCCRWR